MKKAVKNARDLFNKETRGLSMEKKRVLLITQEIEPYTEGSEMSKLVARLPKYLSENGYELRILMPRYSSVNERRHRLHEVVRLSGMNIIIDDDDYPLIIKVASLPGSRLQVYFLDNEEFFKRPGMYGNEEAYEDNADRAAFFCKGAIEIVKKFGWAPDLILCQGWMTGLVPFFLKTAYRTEPLFANTETVFGMFYSDHELMTERFFAKAAINNIKESDLEPFRTADGRASLHQGASAYADGVIAGSEMEGMDVGFLSNLTEKPVHVWKTEQEFLTGTLATLRRLLEVPVED
jgi:starch synthase